MSTSRRHLFLWGIIFLVFFGFLLLVRDDTQLPAEDRPLNGVPILTYHKVSPDRKSGGFGLRITPADFDWEMRYLKDCGYQTVSLGDVVEHFQTGRQLPDKPLVITFDDGYQDNYLYAWPILKKYGFTATIFVIPNLVGGINEFDFQAGLQPKNKMLSWQEIREMNTHGITIGAHTLDHVRLTSVDPAEARRQIAEAKQILERKLGREIFYFCYPYGAFNREIAVMVREGGYTAATCSQGGLVKSDMDPYQLKRIRITGYLNHRQFVRTLHQY